MNEDHWVLSGAAEEAGDGAASQAGPRQADAPGKSPPAKHGKEKKRSRAAVADKAADDVEPAGKQRKRGKEARSIAPATKPPKDGGAGDQGAGGQGSGAQATGKQAKQQGGRAQARGGSAVRNGVRKSGTKGSGGAAALAAYAGKKRGAGKEEGKEEATGRVRREKEDRLVDALAAAGTPAGGKKRRRSGAKAADMDSLDKQLSHRARQLFGLGGGATGGTAMAVDARWLHAT